MNLHEYKKTEIKNPRTYYCSDCQEWIGSKRIQHRALCDSCFGGLSRRISKDYYKKNKKKILGRRKRKMKPKHEYFTTKSNAFNLVFKPLTIPDSMPPIVTLNGLVMLEGTDYYIDYQNNNLIFTGQNVKASDDPTVQIFYWTLG